MRPAGSFLERLHDLTDVLGQGILPIRHDIQALRPEHEIIQDAVGRPPSRAGIVRAGHRHDPDLQPGQTNDLSGVIIPAASSLRGAVVQAVALCIHEELDLPGHISGIAGSAPLIIDHTDLILLLGQGQNALGEISAH